MDTCVVACRKLKATKAGWAGTDTIPARPSKSDDLPGGECKCG